MVAQVAHAVCRAPPGRADRRAAAGAAADDHRRAGRGGDRQDAGEDAQGRDALVDALDGREVGLTQSAVPRIWQAFGLQPHRQDTWKLSKDPLFIEKVHDVVGLYLNPPERAVVLCVDEKSQIQALDRTAPILPMLPGTPERATHDYKRAGTSSLYAALDLTTGKVIGRAAQPPSRDRVQAVPADASTARSPPSSTSTSCSTTAARTRRRRSRNGCPRTPASSCTSPRPASSWLNLVERWFAELTTKKLTPRRAPLRPRPQRRHPRLDRDLERRPQALRLDQDRRPDPRLHRPLLHPNQRITTLAQERQVPVRRRSARWGP